jgi:hypothetical protein
VEGGGEAREVGEEEEVAEVVVVVVVVELTLHLPGAFQRRTSWGRNIMHA